jgi:hypothetical protein
MKEPYADVHHPAVLSAIVGGLAGGTLGTFGFVTFLFVAPPLHVKIGVSHALFTLLFIALPVPIGALVGWWQSVRVIRFVSWWLASWASRLQRPTGAYIGNTKNH